MTSSFCCYLDWCHKPPEEDRCACVPVPPVDRAGVGVCGRETVVNIASYSTDCRYQRLISIIPV